MGPRAWDLASYMASIPREIDYLHSKEGSFLYTMNAITERELKHYVEMFLTLEYQFRAKS